MLSILDRKFTSLLLKNLKNKHQCRDLYDHDADYFNKH